MENFFLEDAPSGPSFIWLAGTIRLIDALGAAAFITASYTTLACEMSEIIARAMSITETAFGLGLATGPVFGGLLFDIGGFRLPFIVVGSLLLLGTAVNFFLFANDDADIPTQNISLWKMLSDVDFLIDVMSVISCFALIGFNEASLEPHIRQFNLTPTLTGAVFLTGGLTDAISCVIWGFFVERVSNPQYLTFVGSVLFILSFLTVGPVSFIPYPTKLWLVVVSQFLLGLGMAGEIVCSFTHALLHLIEKGFPNEVGTYSLISGILFSSACFGAFFGPSLGGYLIDEIGYIRTTEVVVAFKSIMAVMLASRLIFLIFKKKNLEETKILKN